MKIIEVTNGDKSIRDMLTTRQLHLYNNGYEPVSIPEEMMLEHFSAWNDIIVENVEYEAKRVAMPNLDENNVLIVYCDGVEFLESEFVGINQEYFITVECDDNASPLKQ